MSARRFLWQPAVHGQFWAAQPGDIVEVPEEKMHIVSYHLANVPGVNGQPCLVPVTEDGEPEAPAPAPTRRRGRSAPEP